jgi:hypothetical protein
MRHQLENSANTKKSVNKKIIKRTKKIIGKVLSVTIESANLKHRLELQNKKILIFSIKVEY